MRGNNKLHKIATANANHLSCLVNSALNVIHQAISFTVKTLVCHCTSLLAMLHSAVDIGLAMQDYSVSEGASNLPGFSSCFNTLFHLITSFKLNS